MALEERTREGLHLLCDDDARDRGVVVAFTDRIGGTSEAPFNELNLAARVGDDAAAVETNRARVATALGFDGTELTLARQVHGNGFIEVTDERGIVGQADALIARGTGPVLAMLTADCVPVLLWGERGVAAVHAGWRGLAAGVIPRTVDALGEVTTAWVGPSIHDCCYEVGPEVVDAFHRAGLPVAGEGRVDPGGAALAALRRAGVETIEATSRCTSCEARYFSYRRDGVTGRQGAFIALIDA